MICAFRCVNKMVLHHSCTLNKGLAKKTKEPEKCVMSESHDPGTRDYVKYRMQQSWILTMRSANFTAGNIYITATSFSSATLHAADRSSVDSC